MSRDGNNVHFFAIFVLFVQTYGIKMLITRILIKPLCFTCAAHHSSTSKGGLFHQIPSYHIVNSQRVEMTKGDYTRELEVDLFDGDILFWNI